MAFGIQVEKGWGGAEGGRAGSKRNGVDGWVGGQACGWRVQFTDLPAGRLGMRQVASQKKGKELLLGWAAATSAHGSTWCELNLRLSAWF